MKLKKEDKIRYCTACNSEVKERASVRIHVTNPWHRYKGSGLPFVSIASSKMCKKCFKSFKKELEALMLKY